MKVCPYCDGEVLEPPGKPLVCSTCKRILIDKERIVDNLRIPRYSV